MEEDLLSLSKILLDFGINPQNLDCKNSTKYYELLIQHIITLKSQGKLAQNYQAKFTSTFTHLMEIIKTMALWQLLIISML